MPAGNVNFSGDLTSSRCTRQRWWWVRGDYVHISQRPSDLSSRFSVPVSLVPFATLRIFSTKYYNSVRLVIGCRGREICTIPWLEVAKLAYGVSPPEFFKEVNDVNYISWDESFPRHVWGKLYGQTRRLSDQHLPSVTQKRFIAQHEPISLYPRLCHMRSTQATPDLPTPHIAWTNGVFKVQELPCMGWPKFTTRYNSGIRHLGSNAGQTPRQPNRRDGKSSSINKESRCARVTRSDAQHRSTDSKEVSYVLSCERILLCPLVRSPPYGEHRTKIGSTASLNECSITFWYYSTLAMHSQSL